MKRRLRTAPVLFAPAVALALSVALTGTAGASWSSSGSGNAKAKATQLPAGSTPSLAQTGTAPNRAVTVSWTASTSPVNAYVVRAFDAGTSAERATTGTCAGTVTGTSCSENPAASGTWRYTVTPKRSNWLGAQSAASASMLVDNVNPTGSITSPSAGATVSRTVTVTSNSADTGGSGLATVAFQYQPSGQSTWTTIGTPSTATSASWNTTSLGDGVYLLRVVTTDGAGNATTSATVSVTVDNPKATIVLTNGNNTAAKGDAVAITWSSPMNLTTFCSGWTGTTINGSGVVTVTITDNGSNDTLTVSTSSSACGGSLHFGSLSLGANYVSGTVTFNGSGNGGNASAISWSGNTMTITLGAVLTGSGNLLTITGNPTVSYTPDAAIRDSAGQPPTGPFTATTKF